MFRILRSVPLFSNTSDDWSRVHLHAASKLHRLAIALPQGPADRKLGVLATKAHEVRDNDEGKDKE